MIFALVGNKCDLDYNRKVQTEEAQKYANEHNCIFQEVSAMNGDGIQELFMNKLIEQIRTQFIQKGKYTIDEEEEKERLKKEMNYIMDLLEKIIFIIDLIIKVKVNQIFVMII